MKTLPTLLKPLPMFARAKACLSLLLLSSKPRVCWRRWQNSDTWTANWALSMLVSLSQSLTQWEGTQHANSALVNSCLCVSGKILTLGRRIGHSPCQGCVPAITLHRRLGPAGRSIVFPSNNGKKAASAGCRVNFSRWQNCLWRCHARCLRGFARETGWVGIVCGNFYSITRDRDSQEGLNKAFFP